MKVFIVLNRHLNEDTEILEVFDNQKSAIEYKKQCSDSDVIEIIEKNVSKSVKNKSTPKSRRDNFFADINTVLADNPTISAIYIYTDDDWDAIDFDMLLTYKYVTTTDIQNCMATNPIYSTYDLDDIRDVKSMITDMRNDIKCSNAFPELDSIMNNLVENNKKYANILKDYDTPHLVFVNPTFFEN